MLWIVSCAFVPDGGSCCAAWGRGCWVSYGDGVRARGKRAVCRCCVQDLRVQGPARGQPVDCARVLCGDALLCDAAPRRVRAPGRE